MRAALAYASAFGVVATCVASRPAAQRDAWLAYLSTNLTNLADHPVRALVGSAFVTDDPNLLGWTALALVGLAAAGEVLGDLRLGGESVDRTDTTEHFAPAAFHASKSARVRSVGG